MAVNPEAKAREQQVAKLREIGRTLAGKSDHLTGDEKVAIAIICNQAADEIEDLVTVIARAHGTLAKVLP